MSIAVAVAVLLSIGTSAQAATTTISEVSDPSSQTNPVGAPDNDLLSRLHTYRPTYGTIGKDTDTDVRFQISFRYDLLHVAPASSWHGAVDLGYVQKMFRDQGARSQPFHDVDYEPEIMYVAEGPIGGLHATFQGGALHQSNGLSGPKSRSANSLYLEPGLALPIGGEWSIRLAPRIWTYVSRSVFNADIDQYRGDTGIRVGIGKAGGLWIDTFTSASTRSGRVSTDGNVSFPLTRISGSLGAYAFAQGYDGWGETMLDYDRRDRRLRLGLALTR